MAISLAQDAIALLIDLAERGEIDPWDVKVIDVIDRFLSELAPSNATGRDQYESNLSQSGQAFLYASMLLLLKADSLTQAEQVELAEDGLDLGEDWAGAEFDHQSPLPANLEHQLRRRAVARPPQRRRVTLKELIEQLQVIAAALEEPTRPKMRRAKPQSRSQAVKAIAQLAHQENLSEMAVAIDQFFAEYWAEISKGEVWIDFDLVLEFWIQIKQQNPHLIEENPHTNDPETHERVGVFWALLLLSAQSKVEMAQDEFYQDLKVRTLSLQDCGLTELSSTVLPD
jgi:segregation and condensation protein A